MAKNDETKEAKNVAAENDPWKIMKEIFVPKVPNSRDQPDVVASVNGRHFSVQRGKPVMVPAPIWEVIKRSLDAETEAERFYFESSGITEN